MIILKRRLIPYETILLATQGDAIAISDVLRFYKGYITTLSTKQFIDECGTQHISIDEDLYRRLETKLIAKILVFKAV